MGGYAVGQYRFSQARRGLYGDNAVAFLAQTLDLSDPEFNEKDLKPGLLATLDKYTDITLLHAKMSSFMSGGWDSFYGVYATGRITQPPLISGDYFDSEMLKADENICVCGCNASGNIGAVAKDGSYYVTDSISGVSYRVIGNVGVPWADVKLNWVILVNLTSVSITPADYLPYIIDGKNAAEVSACYEAVKAYFESNGCTVTRTDLPISSFTLAEFLDMSTVNIIMYAFAAFTTVLATVPLTVRWAQKRRSSVAVKRMLGVGSAVICRETLGRLALLFHIGFIIGVLAFAALKLSGVVADEPVIPVIVAAYVICLAFNLLVCAVPLSVLLAVEPGDALRKE